ncbi:MAG TPA: hypothetical protein VKR06_35770 [Ktedonosporobacter sp.]|nr:hypothetical protein [Ktedonosporobacter sp.]
MLNSYEQKVLAHLQDMLLKDDPGIGSEARRIAVDKVSLELGGTEGYWIVILFREIQRPHCLFGFRTLAREPLPPNLSERQQKTYDDSDGEGPQVDADMIAARLREHIEAADMGLPQNCDSDGITWI